jgi:hypothetical protein
MYLESFRLHDDQLVLEILERQSDASAMGLKEVIVRRH